MTSSLQRAGELHSARIMIKRWRKPDSLSISLKHSDSIPGCSPPNIPRHAAGMKISLLSVLRFVFHD